MHMSSRSLNPGTTCSDGIVEGFATTSWTDSLPVCMLSPPPTSIINGTSVRPLLPWCAIWWPFLSLKPPIIMKLSRRKCFVVSVHVKVLIRGNLQGTELVMTYRQLLLNYFWMILTRYFGIEVCYRACICRCVLTSSVISMKIISL